MLYLDNNATTRVADEVLRAMLPFFAESYGNPSSTHHFGARNSGAIDQARAAVANLIGARDRDVIFTSGGTESDNAAIRGIAAARANTRHVVISAVEHPAVSEVADHYAQLGYKLTRIGVDAEGRLDLGQLADAVTAETTLISIMLANNETGIIFPLEEVARIAGQHGVPVHTDAVQAMGKLPVEVETLGVAALSLSGHKYHGPKGVGALYLRRGIPFETQMLGGKQERGRRGGTLNVPGIVGLGKACELAADPARLSTMAMLRDRFELGLLARIPDAVVIGRNVPRLCNTSCVCFPGFASEPLVMLLSQHDVCVSAGAACASGSLEPSPILLAMGIAPEVAQGQVRFTLSHETAADDIDQVLEILPRVLDKISASSVL
jgi:cysteine desulfurase